MFTYLDFRDILYFIGIILTNIMFRKYSKCSDDIINQILKKFDYCVNRR